MNNDLNQDFVAGEYVVGIDAGGTRTRAVVAAVRGGDPLGEGGGGPGNALTVAVPQLTEHLVEALGRAVPERLRRGVVAVAGGFAGAARTADEPGRTRARAALTEALRRLGIPARSVEIHSDIEVAFASAPGHPADGLALVGGTGAVAARIEDRVCGAIAGGDGWLLGDDGSGFWIGREAARAALRMADGRGRPTALAALVGRELGVPGEVLPGGEPPGGGRVPGIGPGGVLPGEVSLGDSLMGEADHGGTGLSYGDEGGPGWTRAQRSAYRMYVLPAVMDRPPVRLAGLAPLVTLAAQDKDPVAEAILQEAADHLADTVEALAPRPGERLVVTGGLLGPDGPLLAPVAERLRVLGLTVDRVTDGCPGAMALARLALADED
ncbi:N-acetylglucosamine kinase [Streptomyces griseus]|uniref:N-acetylglucosamine kinase n=1 Tax=Streptomyces griseus TaxID=1911 RepID=UPI00068A6040|nr:BadF/BadG/BcrA/BcrD ATPase family protein [Streptomyces griseus]